MIASAELAALGTVVRRTPCPDASSWPIDDVVLRRPDGVRLRVLVKQLEGDGGGKPRFLRDPGREIEAYRLLAGAGLDTPRCLATGRWWIALERVDGVALWQRGDLEAWCAAARWAASLHARFEGRRWPASHLLCHDERLQRRWLARARAIAGPEVDSLREATDRAVARLAALPRTLVHGELYPSNVLIGDDRVTAVDWEMAAHGPAVIDLAALVTGWDPDSRAAIVAAFGGADPGDLAAARLVLALQWLGWMERWTPPPEHRHDWLAEARAAAGELG